MSAKPHAWPRCRSASSHDRMILPIDFNRVYKAHIAPALEAAVPEAFRAG